MYITCLLGLKGLEKKNYININQYISKYTVLKEWNVLRVLSFSEIQTNLTSLKMGSHKIENN